MSSSLILPARAMTSLATLRDGMGLLRNLASPVVRQTLVLNPACSRSRAQFLWSGRVGAACGGTLLPSRHQGHYWKDVEVTNVAHSPGQLDPMRDFRRPPSIQQSLRQWFGDSLDLFRRVCTGLTGILRHTGGRGSERMGPSCRSPGRPYDHLWMV